MYSYFFYVQMHEVQDGYALELTVDDNASVVVDKDVGVLESGYERGVLDVVKVDNAVLIDAGSEVVERDSLVKSYIYKFKMRKKKSRGRGRQIYRYR